MRLRACLVCSVWLCTSATVVGAMQEPSALESLHSKLERLQLDAVDSGVAGAALEGLYAKLEQLELLTELDATGDGREITELEGDAKLEGLYAKLERLEMLTELVAAGGEGGQQLELVASLAVAAPELRADQLERLLADLRESAVAGETAGTAPKPTVVNYDEEEWHGGRLESDAEFEDYPLMDEVDAEVGWEEPAELKDAALRHWLYMQKAATCGSPAPRTICVQDVHPHAGNIYLPSCVLLHRCSFDTGCCLNSALSCAPLQSHLRVVRLPLYVLTVGRGNTEERLPFVNHTSCACANRTQAAAAARTESELLALALGRATARAREETTPSGGGGAMANDDIDSTRRPLTQRSAASQHVTTLAPHLTEEPSAPLAKSPPHRSSTCRCPRGFDPSWSEPGSADEKNAVNADACTCECRQRDCATLAKGKEHFGLADRLCMKRMLCTTPRCDYGAYLRAAGRCPRRRREPVSGRFTSRQT